MSIPWNAIAERSAGALPSVCADRVIVRRFDPASDSYAQLTPMLHRAFARLGAMGLNCTCVDQDEDVTRRRAQAGECYVAVCGGRVIGTATLYATDPSSACSLYRCEGVASVRQVAVDPDCQSRGIGALLLSFAEQWAALRGYTLLALDTPHPASHLLAFYGAQGFEVVDTMRFAGKRYDSAILCKRPVARFARRVSPASRLAARVAGVAAGCARGGGAASRVCVAVARGRAGPARPACAPCHRMGSTACGRRRELPLVAVAAAPAWALRGPITACLIAWRACQYRERPGRRILATIVRDRALRLSIKPGACGKRRIKKDTNTGRRYSSRPPFARRHAIVPSTPTATTSAPHNT